MKSAIMQPYLFPYLGYWQLMNLADEYIIYDDVNYIKGGWINRNRIKINGSSAVFGFSVSNASQNRRINEHTICLGEEDRRSLIRKLECAYKKAPCYKETIELFTDVIMYHETNLAAFLANCNRKTAEYMGISTKIYSATELQLDHTHGGQQRIIDICQERGYSEYINAYGGKELYDKEVFAQNGISLSFLKMDEDIVYPQGKGEFIPGLSILDVMMYNNPEEVRKLLERYTLE